MNEFYIGQEVKCLASCDNKRNIIGKRGIIKAVRKRILVEFFAYIKGHSGFGHGKDGHCWMVDRDKLRLYAMPVYKKKKRTLLEHGIKRVGNCVRALEKFKCKLEKLNKAIKQRKRRRSHGKS